MVQVEKSGIEPATSWFENQSLYDDLKRRKYFENRFLQRAPLAQSVSGFNRDFAGTIAVSRR
jgi:hypothetical protein